jgi:urease accessory protein UreE
LKQVEIERKWDMSANEGVVAGVLGKVGDFEERVKGFDRLLLTLEERSNPHMVGHTEGGRTIRLSLERGTELIDGDVIAVDGDVAIVVAAAPEDIFVVSPRDAVEWGVAGYQLGNLHKQVRFTHDTMLTPADAAVAGILDRLEIPYDRGMTPFVGKRYGSHHHHHD